MIHAAKVAVVTIEDELKKSYLDYAMSVIVGRALPDVRDGLKPVHRRVLFAMRELSNDWNKPYKKSARIVGDVIGKYHPHGDSAVYDTIVRMAQDFSLRYLLVDGQGNFGSIDGDPPAAMRYTEVRMTKLAHELLADLDKETVEFAPNYDNTEFVPIILPTKIPNILVNGSSGIAVGMASNIPPHNLTEVITAVIALIEDPNLSLEQIMEYIPGPDFPTAGIINGREGIVEAYSTGRGRIVMRGRTAVETDEESGKQSIIINELPYQVNKARLIEKIAELVKDKRLEGVSNLRDESDKDGMRVVIELKRGTLLEVVLNHLYSFTMLESAFGVNMVALVDNRPQLFTLRGLLDAFITHRKEVVTRRTIFDLQKTRERAHILEGLAVALTNLDAMITLIRAAKTPQDAKQELLSGAWPCGLIKNYIQQENYQTIRPQKLAAQYGLVDEVYRLSTEQAQAILDLRLHRLTSLEQDKILADYQDLLITIKELLAILADEQKLLMIIKDELQAMKQAFADKRRTEIQGAKPTLALADLITPADVVVTLSHRGYIKYQLLDAYHAQRRGGRGKSATKLREEDFIQQLLVAHTHATLLCFSSKGKVYWLKVYELPQANAQAQGKPIINLLPLEEGEVINTILPLPPVEDSGDIDEAALEAESGAPEEVVFLVTARGVVKKLRLQLLARQRSNGLIVMNLQENDTLIGAVVTQSNAELMLFANNGRALRFSASQVRASGRLSMGVRGMRVANNDCVIALLIIDNNTNILIAHENGHGKRVKFAEFTAHHRGGMGIRASCVNKRNGKLIAALPVAEQEEVMLISEHGTLVRLRACDVSLLGRNAQGVRLINLRIGTERLASVARIGEVDTAIDDVTDNVDAVVES